MSSIFWEDIWRADLEGRCNFLHLNGYNEGRGEDRGGPKNVTHEDSRPQQGTSHMDPYRSPRSNSHVDKSIPSQSSPPVDQSIPPQATPPAYEMRVLHELKSLKQIVEKLNTETKSNYSRIESLLMENTQQVHILTDIVTRFISQQSVSGGGYRCGNDDEGRGVGENSGAGIGYVGENSRGGGGGGGVGENSRGGGGSGGVGENGGSGIGDVGENSRGGGGGGGVGENSGAGEADVRIGVERDDADDSYYQTPSCTNDGVNMEDVLDVVQLQRRPKRHLKKSKYKRTPYTDPGLKKIMFSKRSIQDFDPLRLPEEMKEAFEKYKQSNPKSSFTSGLGL